MLRASRFTYLLVTSGAGAVLAAPWGVLGAIASLAPTYALVAVGIVVMAALGAIAGLLVGLISWSIRSPITFALIGAIYAGVVGFILSAITASWITGEGTGNFSTEAISNSRLIVLILTPVIGGLTGSAPSLFWKLYTRMRLSRKS
jgi:hypothetical protein